MPVYEYKCKDCGHKFCLLQTVSASRTGVQCPNCCGTRTERIVSRFAGPRSSCNSQGPFS
ncbi:MAG: FmdB family zinc ribbon protein [Armatimonadota bacterium]